MPSGMEGSRMDEAKAAGGDEWMRRQGGNRPFLTGKEPVRPLLSGTLFSLEHGVPQLLTCTCTLPVP